MYTLYKIILFVFGMSLLIFGCNNANSKLPPNDHNRAFKVLINKKAHTLALFSESTLVKTYKCSFGRNPSGDKEIEGDNKTPVGKFYIASKKAETRFHRFFCIIYPSIE